MRIVSPLTISGSTGKLVFYVSLNEEYTSQNLSLANYMYDSIKTFTCKTRKKIKKPVEVPQWMMTHSTSHPNSFDCPLSKRIGELPVEQIPVN